MLIGEDGAPFFDKNKPVSFSINGRVWVNNHVHVLRTNKKINDQFLSHVLNTIDYKTYIKGSTRDKLNQTELKQIIVQVPSVQEQKEIVSYIDKKTEKIDRLIEKKEQLIELLKEKRTALITETVTKGLDPDLEMKDSGVEWLGEIPKDWKVYKLKQISKIKPSNVDKKINEEEEKVELCNYTDVYYEKNIDESVDFMEATAKSGEIKKFQLNEGDVLITKDSEDWKDIAVPTYVAKCFEGVLCGYHLAKIEPFKEKLLGKFLYYAVKSEAIAHHFRVESKGVTRFGLSTHGIKEGPILIPPIPEQQDIVDFLDRETDKIDQLVAKIEEAIKKLKEYRTALITNAVTGKIDVREEV